MAKVTVKLRKFKMPLRYKVIFVLCKPLGIATLGKMKISYKKHDDGIVLTFMFSSGILGFLLKSSFLLKRSTRIAMGFLKEWAKQNNIPLSLP